MANAIEIRALRKSFGRTVALDGLDLTVRAGEVHAFLGPNGAGKTTTIRILLGLLRKDGGQAALLGGDPWRDAVGLHRRLAYVPGDVTLWPGLTGGEIIDLLGRLRGGLDARAPPGADRAVRPGPRQEGPRLLQGQPAEGRADRRAGQRRRAAAAGRADRRAGPADGGRVPATASPTSGTTAAPILLSSHILAEAEALSDRVTIIRDGRAVETGTLAEMRHLTRDFVDAELAGPVTLDGLPGVHDLQADGLRVRCEVDHAALNEVLGRLHAAGIRSLTCRPPTLEELFLRHYSTERTVASGVPG